MKSAVVTAFDAPLEIQERPVPQPGPGQVLVRMEACGLCHTDIHAAHGDWPVKPSPPFVPGPLEPVPLPEFAPLPVPAPVPAPPVEVLPLPWPAVPP